MHYVTDHLLVYSPAYLPDDDDDAAACGLFNEMSAVVSCFCAVPGLCQACFINSQGSCTVCPMLYTAYTACTNAFADY